LIWGVQDSLLAQTFSLSAHEVHPIATTYFEPSIAAAQDGGLYAVSTLFQSVPLIIATDTIVTEFDRSVYMAKYDSNLGLEWITILAENDFNTGGGILVPRVYNDDVGNIYVAINFYETLYFFGDSAGGEDFYGLQILKMDPNGILLWAETIEHAWITENGLVVNGSGDIFITARMDQQVITMGYTDVGSLIWTQSVFGLEDFEKPWGIALDGNSNVYVTASITASNNVYLDGQQVIFQPEANDASLLIKYDPSGVLEWYRILYAIEAESIALALACDASNNVVLVGAYTDSLLYFSNGISPVGQQEAGRSSSFNVTFSGAGDRLGFTTTPSLDYGNDYAANIAILNENRVVITMFEEALSTGNDTLISAGIYDFAIQLMDPYGTSLRTTHVAGSSSWERPTDLVTMNGAIYVAGVSESHNLSVDSVNIANYSGDKAFILKLTQDPIGIAEELLAPDLHIYPNPSNGSFTVHGLTAVSSYTITDLAGRTLATGRTNANGLTEIRMPSEMRGAFLIRFDQLGQQITRKVIVQ